jgi:alpha-L-fucosidase
VGLLGSKAKLGWNRSAEGLVVTLPPGKVSTYTCALRIEGAGLKPAPLVEEFSVTQPDANGELTLLAGDAEVHGQKLNTEDRDGQMNLGFWDNPAEWASWRVRVSKPGKFNVTAAIATINSGSELSVEAGATRISKRLEATGDWGAFKTVDLGTIDLSGGEQVLNVRPKEASSWKPINLRALKLKPVQD